MSTTDDGTTDGPTTLTGERVCPTCEGFGAWHGDGDGDGQILVECTSCGRRWSAPDHRSD